MQSLQLVPIATWRFELETADPDFRANFGCDVEASLVQVLSLAFAFA